MNDDQITDPIYIKTVGGLDIYFTPMVEYIRPQEEFDEGEFFNVIKEINNGSMKWFCAKVHAEVKGVELAEDYLGCCCYETFEEFYNMEGDHFSDMVETVMTNSKELLKEINREVLGN